MSASPREIAFLGVLAEVAFRARVAAFSVYTGAKQFDRLLELLMRDLKSMSSRCMYMCRHVNIRFTVRDLLML